MVDKLLYTNGKTLKNIDFPQYPDEAWDFAGEEPASGKEDLYASVAAVFRAVNMTADAVANLPYAVMRGEEEVDNSDDWQNVCGFMPNPRELIRLWRLSLFFTNAAYGFMEGNTLKKKLRYIVPTTITPIINKEIPKKPTDPAYGQLLGFTRKIGTTSKDYTLEDNRIFYIWRLDHTTELLPAKATEFNALMAAAGVIYYTDYFMEQFFQRGGIKPTMLMVKGAPNQAEREKIEKIWDRVIRGVYKYLGKIFNAEAITPVVIGEGVDNLKDQGIYQNKLSDIAMACGMPLSLLLANSANYATAMVEYKAWFDHEIVPWAEFMAEAMNEQLFKPLGLKFEFRPEVTDPGQEDEVSRAGAYQAYVNAGMKPSIAAQVVGIELPHGVEYEDLDPEEEPEPEPMPEEETIPVIEESDTDEDEQEEETEAKFIPTLEQYKELDLWQTLAFRKLKKGELDTMTFEAKTIPEQIAWTITELLSLAKTEDDIKSAFVFDTFQPEVKAVDNLAIIELAEAINQAVKSMSDEEAKPEPVQPVQPVNNFTFNLADMVKAQVNVPEQLQPVIQVNVPEQMAPIVNVQPPVNNITVEQPDITIKIPPAPKSAKVKRDNDGNISGIEVTNG